MKVQTLLKGESVIHLYGRAVGAPTCVGTSTGRVPGGSLRPRGGARARACLHPMDPQSFSGRYLEPRCLCEKYVSPIVLDLLRDRLGQKGYTVILIFGDANLEMIVVEVILVEAILWKQTEITGRLANS